MSGKEARPVTKSVMGKARTLIFAQPEQPRTCRNMTSSTGHLASASTAKSGTELTRGRTLIKSRIAALY